MDASLLQSEGYQTAAKSRMPGCCKEQASRMLQRASSKACLKNRLKGFCHAQDVRLLLSNIKLSPNQNKGVLRRGGGGGRPKKKNRLPGFFQVQDARLLRSAGHKTAAKSRPSGC